MQFYNSALGCCGFAGIYGIPMREQDFKDNLMDLVKRGLASFRYAIIQIVMTHLQEVYARDYILKMGFREGSDLITNPNTQNRLRLYWIPAKELEALHKSWLEEKIERAKPRFSQPTLPPQPMPAPPAPIPEVIQPMPMAVAPTPVVKKATKARDTASKDALVKSLEIPLFFASQRVVKKRIKPFSTF